MGIDAGTNISIRRELCKRQFSFFLAHFWETIIVDEPVFNWHIPYLCDELQRAGERVFMLKDDEGNIIKKREPKEKDIIINIPPGSTKSTIVTIAFPVWCWINDPTIRFITGSYSANLAMEQSVKARDIIQSPKFKAYFPDLVLKHDQNNKQYYENNHKGTRVTASVNGTITGKHAHIIIIDDPINPKQAASDVELKNANDWIDQTLSTRKANKAVTLTIYVMQRLHEEDPTGHLLTKNPDAIMHYCLPAEESDLVKPSELRQYYVNGLMDPIRMSAEILEQEKINLGSYGYAGQFDQDPAPAKGKIWQKWFTEIPDNLFPQISELEDYGTDWDTAFGEKEENAASAYITSGLHKINKKMYIDDLDFRNLEFPDLINWMLSLPSPHYIEAKASGKSSKQTLNKMKVAAIEIPVLGGDKVSRARNATPFAQSGMVCIRKSLADKLYNHLEQGILKFPKNKKMDVADALAQAIQRHFSKKRYGKAPKATA